MHSIDITSADSLLVEFHCENIELAASKVAELGHFLKSRYSEEIIDLVPAYNSLGIFVDFPRVLPQDFKTSLEKHLEYPAAPNTQLSGQKHTLPCFYDFETGLDLERLCNEKKLSKEAFIELHSEQRYTVYAIGFSPGFPYLGEVDSRIASPRLASPRKKVPWGSVGIADRQTGIYPNTSPGGWNIIGRCPSLLFQNPNETRNSSEICLLNVGDTVKFKSIHREEYLALMEEYDREP